MPALDATVGGVNANSYLTVVEAQAYVDTRFNVSAWTSASPTTNRDLALMAATARLEQEKYVGTRATTTQRLKWPRTGAKDDDAVAIPENVIPREVKEATVEIALELLRNPTSDVFAGTGLEGYKSLSVGSISIELRDPPGSSATEEGEPSMVAISRWQLPFQVQRLLRHLLRTDDVPFSALTGVVRLSRT